MTPLDRVRADLDAAQIIFRKAECTVLESDLRLLLALADAVRAYPPLGYTPECGNVLAALLALTTEEKP